MQKMLFLCILLSSFFVQAGEIEMEQVNLIESTKIEYRKQILHFLTYSDTLKFHNGIIRANPQSQSKNLPVQTENRLYSYHQIRSLLKAASYEYTKMLRFQYEVLSKEMQVSNNAQRNAIVLKMNSLQETELEFTRRLSHFMPKSLAEKSAVGAAMAVGGVVFVFLIAFILYYGFLGLVPLAGAPFAAAFKKIVISLGVLIGATGGYLQSKDHFLAYEVSLLDKDIAVQVELLKEHSKSSHVQSVVLP